MRAGIAGIVPAKQRKLLEDSGLLQALQGGRTMVDTRI
jgi:hypothetical protein